MNLREVEYKRCNGKSERMENRIRKVGKESRKQG